MMTLNPPTLVKIGVFYDGHYFFHVSNYYAYHHARRSRISIAGLHDFIRQEVARCEQTDARRCHIVDAHYFRGRPFASSDNSDQVLKERKFDDVLVQEGVVTHYLPLSPQGSEKGIDVWLALEAYELAVYKRLEVAVLVASDGDFVPLARKLHTLGTRVMVLAWDFTWSDERDGEAREHETRTAQSLLDEATYPVMMHDILDDRSRQSDPVIRNLFLPSRERDPIPARPDAALKTYSSLSKEGGTGRIQALKEGFGFITPEDGGDNLFFYRGDVAHPDFSLLYVGMRVRYQMGRNNQGPCAVQVEAMEEPVLWSS